MRWRFSPWRPTPLNLQEKASEGANEEASEEASEEAFEEDRGAAAPG